MNIFFIIHIIIFLVAIIIPFIGNNQILELYSLLIPFVMFHWVMNDDTCCLTHMEHKFTNTPIDQTFSGRIIGPIYNLSDDDSGKCIKLILFSLWLFTQYRTGHIYKTLPNLKFLNPIK